MCGANSCVKKILITRALPKELKTAVGLIIIELLKRFGHNEAIGGSIMRTEQIHYLAEIHQQMSLHKAAETLHLSPQALSLSMNALEKELEMNLLIRTKSGTFLTRQGIKVLSAGSIFLEALKNIKNEQTETYPALTQGLLPLAMTSGVAETIYPSLVSQLFAEYPKLTLDSQKLRVQDIAAGTALREAEIGLVYQVSIDQRPSLNFKDTPYVFVPVQPGQYYCLAHHKYALCRYKRISLKTIAQYPLIIYQPTRVVLQGILDYAGVKKQIIEVEDFAVYRQMLKDGNGIGLYVVMEGAAQPSIGGELQLIAFKEQIDSTMGYIYQGNRPLSPQAEAFTQYLQDFCQKHMDRNFSVL